MAAFPFANTGESRLPLGDLSYRFLLQRDGTRAARRTPHAIAEQSDVNLQFVDGAAQRIAVHFELTRGSALVTFVFLQDSEDKSFLEFPDSFGVKDVALVHLHDERFQLIFHGGSLFLFRSTNLFE
jgi:hypothetical protein